MGTAARPVAGGTEGVITGYLNARSLAVTAMSREIAPAQRADELDGAADALLTATSEGDTGPTAVATRAYAEGLRALAALERWEHDTLAAAPDAERHHRAAELRASRAAAELSPDDALAGPLRDVLLALAAVKNFDDRHHVREMLLAAALPAPLIDPPRQPAVPASIDAEAALAKPRAAVITSLAGSPVSAAQAISPGQVHDLGIEARVLDWPDDARQLAVRYVSRWPAGAVEVPDVVIDRPDNPTEGVWTGRGEGYLVLHAGPADPLTSIQFGVSAELVRPEGGTPIKVLGHAGFAVRTFDPVHDVITGAPVLDERILGMLSELREQKIAPSEQPAFGRLLGAIARAGVRILADRTFPVGSNPNEKDFQAELRTRLGMATELGGRLAEHAWQGGGETDLAHDGVVAELKIAKITPATLENAKDYLSQSTQYASGGQHQISILAILDLTHKDAPPGVLANTVGWLEPRLHGLDDPAYPSRVAVIIINANLPLPSDWSR
jgi:hypothetical protein